MNRAFRNTIKARFYHKHWLMNETHHSTEWKLSKYSWMMRHWSDEHLPYF